MLDSRGIDYRYRDYRKEPLSEQELRALLQALGMPAHELLRARDPAFKEHELRGDETDARLIPLLANHPTLLQRPIGWLGDRAAVGRPPEQLLELVG